MSVFDTPLDQRARFLEHVATTMVGTGEFMTMRDYARAWCAEGKAAA
jgi:hypothetical protein